MTSPRHQLRQLAARMAQRLHELPRGEAQDAANMVVGLLGAMQIGSTAHPKLRSALAAELDRLEQALKAEFQ